VGYTTNESAFISGIILRIDLNWVDHVNYTVQKAWKALHFAMRVFKKVNRNTKFSLHVIGTSCSWNMRLHAGIHARKDR